MERRAHWSDDLIDAVRDAVDVEFDDIWKLSDDSILAVIAAVEDWHKAKRDSRVRTHSEGCWRWHNECAESLIEWQQAAIERVLKLCANRQRCLDSAIKHPTAISSISIDEVLQALDGERDE